MRMMLVLTQDEVQREIPYAFICETRYGSTWNTGRRKRAWLSTFTEAERKTASKLFALSHTWYLVKGVPDEVIMSLSTKLLWDKLARFCASI